jgi:nicotinamidase-related amidase
MAAWDDLFSAEDLEGYRKAGFDAPRELGTRPGIVVVDMSYAFVDDRFRTGWGKTGWPCAEAIARLLAVARPRGVPVCFTTMKPTVNRAERGRWKSAGLTLDQELPEKNDIVPVIAPLPDESLLTKRYPSGFFGTELASLLTYHGVDTLIVTGMVTSGCVRATVVDAFSHNYIVVVPEECVADRGDLPHKVNLFDIQQKYGDVLPLESVIGYLERVSAPLAVPAGAAR